MAAKHGEMRFACPSMNRALEAAAESEATLTEIQEALPTNLTLPEPGELFDPESQQGSG